MHYGKYPVHLGANGDAVKFTLQARRATILFTTLPQLALLPRLPEDEDGSSKYEVSIQTDAGETVVERIPKDRN